MKISADIPTGYGVKFTASLKDSTKIVALFLLKVEELLWMEGYIMSLLPKAKKLVNDIKLKAAINNLIPVVQERQECLKKAYSILKGKSYEDNHLSSYHDFLLLTGDFDAVTDTNDKAMRDVAVIFEMQKIARFKIEQYSTLHELAEEHNNRQVSGLTEKMLQSEICCDASLMELAVNYCGYDADDISDFTDDGYES